MNVTALSENNTQKNGQHFYIEKLTHGQDLPLPHYATQDSAGMDLYAAIDSDINMAPGDIRLIPTGIKIALPTGFEGQVRPRSGLAYKNGVTVLNAPGTIDSDYRGEVGVILINHSKTEFTVTRAMRIAQLVIAPVTQISWREVDLIDSETKRGEGGFGHTGV